MKPLRYFLCFLCARLFQALLFQLCPEEDAQGQAVVGVFEVGAQHGGDVGQPV